MPPKPSREKLELENNELRAALEEKNDELEQQKQSQLEKQNNDLKYKLDNVLTKLDQILDENAKLREQNENFADRILTLENLLKYNENSDEPLAADPAQPVLLEAPKKESYHALVLSDSLLRHVGISCPKDLKKTRG